MRYTWDIVVRLRPVIVVAALAYLILALPSQMLELYLIDIDSVRFELSQIGQSPGANEPPLTVLGFLLSLYPIWAAMIAGLLAMLVIWISAAHLVCLTPDHDQWSKARRWFAAGVVVLLALTPVLGVLSGLGNVLSKMAEFVPPGRSVDDDLSALRRDVWTYMGISVALAGLAILPFAYLTFARLEWVRKIGQRVFSPLGIVLGVALILLLTAAIAIWPTVVPGAIGTQALVYLFLAALSFVLTWLSHIYRKTGWPVTVMVIAAAFVFSVFGLNDNHKVEHKIVATDNTSIEKNFEAWLLSRGDRKWFADNGKPYPVYVVAAEGGGMFAGYHIASWLGNLQDSCDRFAQHTFGISSVSGGSLGAAVFAGLTQMSGANHDFRPCAHRRYPYFNWTSAAFFRNDLLAPLVGATLFPDFLQRLIPWPIKAFDRAGALEEAFSVTWDKSVPSFVGKKPDGLFKRPLHSLWDPKGVTPALFLNTSSVASGSRVTIGPLHYTQTSTGMHLNTALCAPYDDRTTTIELPLATAVSLSARFPWLTPAGWFDLSRSACPDKAQRDRVYLVDGGYFENSGLETAIDIATYLRATIGRPDYAKSKGVDLDRIRQEYPHGIDIRIIMLFAIDRTASRYIKSSAERSGSRPGELLPPIQTMLAGRSARTRAVHLNAVEEGNLPYVSADRPHARYVIDPDGDIRFGQDMLHQVWLDGNKFFLPLGWRLSRRSIHLIGNPQSLSPVAEMVRRELMGEDTDDLKGRQTKPPAAPPPPAPASAQ